MKKSDLAFYAGIGSRETPADICDYMTTTAERLARLGFILRSGGAKGADKAFEAGAGKGKVIFRPEHATADSMREASRHHSAWNKCNARAQRLHGRNVLIILGEDSLDNEEMWVQFVISWTPPDIPRGGTKLGMRVAEERRIPVFNLAVPGKREELESLLGRLEREIE